MQILQPSAPGPIDRGPADLPPRPRSPISTRVIRGSSFGDFSLEPADAILTSALAVEVLTLWTTKAALRYHEAERRLSELVVMVRDPAGRLIGVSTARQGRVQQDGEEHWFLRMFFQQESRGVRGLAAHTPEVAFRLLASRPGPAGVLLVTENPKLHSRRIAEAFRRLHWQHLGRGADGREWFGRRFDGNPYESRTVPGSGSP